MAARINLFAAEEAATPANRDMDPRPQLLVTRMRSGVAKTATVSTAENEAAVIARGSDAGSWTALSEVRDATVIGQAAGGGFVVTGRIRVSRIEKVRNQPYVESLKAAQPMRPMLAVATGEAESRPAQMPAGSHVSGGKGVVLGVIDKTLQSDPKVESLLVSKKLKPVEWSDPAHAGIAATQRRAF